MSSFEGVLKCLPYVDSKDHGKGMAAGCTAEVTMKWVKRGFYRDERGEKVNLSDAVRAAKSARIDIASNTHLPVPRQLEFPVTRLQVSNETAQDSAWRLLEYGLDPLIIRWIDGKPTGNDDLLHRSSALHAVLVDHPLYAAHSQNDAASATGDWAVLSPKIPVFRTSTGAFLKEPWCLNVLTSPSPCSAPHPQQSLHRLLAIAQAYGYTTLIWDASTQAAAQSAERLRTAGLFRQALKSG
ncbi:MAG: TIGR02452 family protein, partial [Methylococcaceae bacterium]